MIIPFILILGAFDFLAAQDLKNIEQLIFIGEFEPAEKKIHSLISDPSTSDTTKARLFSMAGEIKKLSGDMEGALFYWKKGNALRSRIFPKGDYHLVWNHALISNYHYEMINPQQAKIYADSCLVLLNDLTAAQQLEIQIYRIWNILAQSIKQAATQGGNYADWWKIYPPVLDLYEQSIEFQISHGTSRHYLAKTYHLYANAHLDLYHSQFHNGSMPELQQQYFDTAVHYYDKAIDIWQELYGDVHYELGKTRFLKAMHYHGKFEKTSPDKVDKSFPLYDQALTAFGLSELKIDSLYEIKNKADLLMCLKLYSDAIFLTLTNAGSKELLPRAEEINRFAIELWKIIHEEFNARNQNLTLSLYYLVPQALTGQIEFFKYKLGLDFSFEHIFDASQHLKYYDLLKDELKPKALPTTVTIAEMQRKLSADEWFIDFFVGGEFVHFAMAIGRDTVLVYELPGRMRYPVIDFNTYIINADYDAFIEQGYELFNDLIRPLPAFKNKKLIICPQEYLNKLPFEALLVTPDSGANKDYRGLDYLIHHCEIEYALSAATFRKHQEPAEFSISAFAPDYSNSTDHSSLPFSQQLVQSLNDKDYGKAFVGDAATAERVLQTKTSSLHLSGHGMIDTERSEFSSLVLNEESLELDEVYAHRCAAKLVVLNTCNSSLGTVLAHDGINGFARAFLSAGAVSVLSNLWEVDDRVSNQLLGKFYDELHDGKSTTSALRAAQLSHIENAANSDQAAPYYWAGHRLVGEEMFFTSGQFSALHLSWTSILTGMVILVLVSGGVWLYQQ